MPVIDIVAVSITLHVANVALLAFAWRADAERRALAVPTWTLPRLPRVPTRPTTPTTPTTPPTPTPTPTPPTTV